MAGPETPNIDLTQVAERFPGQVSLVGRLCEIDETFCSLCGDFALAHEALTRLRKREDAERYAAVISDYEFLIADLEREIATALIKANRHD